MKNLGLLLAGGIGLLWLSKQSKKSTIEDANQVDGTQTPPFDPNIEETERSISANEVFEYGIPEDVPVIMNSQEIELLKNMCNTITQVAPWFINYLSDKSNLLPNTTQKEVEEVVDVFEEMQECVDILCSAVNNLIANKPISNTLALAINDSSQCFIDIENSVNLDSIGQVAYPPQNIPNFLS